MAYDVEHLFGVDVSPAWEELVQGTFWTSLDDDRQDELLFSGGNGPIHRIYDQDKVVLGVKVPVGARGVIVTDEIAKAAVEAIAGLPDEIMAAVRAGMAKRHGRHWRIVREDEAEWLAGRIPAPRFHVCPYRG